jgi:hypothetical protein
MGGRTWSRLAAADALAAGRFACAQRSPLLLSLTPAQLGGPTRAYFESAAP